MFLNSDEGTVAFGGNFFGGENHLTSDSKGAGLETIRIIFQQPAFPGGHDVP